MQRKAAAEHDARAVAVDLDVAQRIASQRHLGRRLPPATRSFFESNIGYDFSEVRIHDDHEAASLSQRLRARAFTVGGNVFFARNEYQPQSLPGKRLLAHELAHTVQQGAAHGRVVHSPLIQRSSDGTTSGVIDEASDHLEKSSSDETLSGKSLEIALPRLSNSAPLPAGGSAAPPAPGLCGKVDPIQPIPSMRGAPPGAQPIVSAAILPWSTSPWGALNISPSLALKDDEFGASQPLGTLVPHATAAPGGWALSGSFNARFLYNVRRDKGPEKQLNVTGPQAPFVTADNYIEIMNDLWPFAGSCGGGAPARRKYWSRLLTIDHELFHIKEQIAAAQIATNEVNAWLLTQSMAGTQADFDRLTNASGARWNHSINVAMAKPASEERAYADGRQGYVDLAFAVFDKF